MKYSTMVEVRFKMRLELVVLQRSRKGNTPENADPNHKDPQKRRWNGGKTAVNFAVAKNLCAQNLEAPLKHPQEKRRKKRARERHRGMHSDRGHNFVE